MSTATVGALRVVLGLDSAQFTAGLTAAQKHLKAVGDRMKSVGAGMAAVGAGLTATVTAPLIAAGFAASKAATEAADAMAQVESALASMGNASGRTAEQLSVLAEGLMRNSLYDDDEILRKVTANLLTFGNIAGAQFDRAQQAAVDLAARMGTDLQSATLMVGKALNDPVKGIAALGRAGIQFTAAQRDQIKAMAEAGNAAGAQRLMLAELERQFGGAAAAAQSTDPYDKLRDSLGTLSESMGGIINTAIVPLLDKLAGLADRFNNLSPATQKFIVAGAAIAAVVGPILVGLGAVVSAIGVLSGAFVAAAPVTAALGAALGAVAAGAVPAIVAALGVILSPIGLVVAAVAGLTFVWVKWGDDIKRIVGNAVADAGAKLRSWGSSIGQWAQGVGSRLGRVTLAFYQAHVDAIRWVSRLYSGVRTWLLDKLGAVFDWVGEKVRRVGQFFFELYDAVVGHSYVPDMVEGIAEWMAKLDAGMVQPAQTATATTREAFQTLRDDVAGIFERLMTDSERATRQLAADMRVLDRALAQGLITREQYNQAVAGAAGENLRAPERQAALEPMADGRDITRQAREAADRIKESMSAVDAKMQDAADRFADRFSYGMEAALNGDLRGVLEAIFGDMRSILSGLGRQIFGALQGGKGGGGFGSFLSTVLGGLKLPAFANGGSMRVGGVGGIDSQVRMIRATPNETISVTKPGQFARSAAANVFDLRGALVTADLLEQINQRVTAGEARAVRSALGASRRAAPGLQQKLRVLGTT